MKTSALSRIFAFVLLLAALGTLSSCNRGYGCPSNFSAGKIVSTAVQLVK